MIFGYQTIPVTLPVFIEARERFPRYCSAKCNEREKVSSRGIEHTNSPAVQKEKENGFSSAGPDRSRRGIHG